MKESTKPYLEAERFVLPSRNKILRPKNLVFPQKLINTAPHALFLNPTRKDHHPPLRFQPTINLFHVKFSVK